MPRFMWMTADAVAEEGYRAVMQNKPVCINGGLNRSIATLAKYLPDSIGFSIMKSQNRSLQRR
jgi:hypothetical protein